MEIVVRDNLIFQVIIQLGIELLFILIVVFENNFFLGIVRLVGLGVDMKIKVKIYVNEYIKLVLLILKLSFEQEFKFKLVEKDG